MIQGRLVGLDTYIVEVLHNKIMIMNSAYNQSTNKVVPIQLTIENGISNTDKANEISSVEEIEQAGCKIVIEGQISNTAQGNGINSLHYMSWVFGILLACGLVGLITLVPQHNILNEPKYWYEFMIFTATGANAILTASIILECAYWANINYAKNWTEFFILCSIGAISTIMIIGSYYLVWTFHFKLFAPMPMTYYSAGTLLWCILQASLWFR